MAEPARTAAVARIDPDTTIGAVRLTVSDLERSRGFYERAIGLVARQLDDGGLALSVDEEPPLIELQGDRAAPPLDRRAPGLYHLAILVPGRVDLAFALARVAEAGWQLDGASDHLVSEALYLSDPDGNGIEIYRDRPRKEWRRIGEELEMATLPLDLDDVLGELRDAGELQARAPAGTTLGHVHLQVSDLGDAETFYHRILGFDVMVRSYPGALFVSAGGYHHHIGLNAWRSAGAAPPTPGAIGLRSFDVVLPNAGALEPVLERARTAGVGIDSSDVGALVHDPSGNCVLLRAR